jgi:hypothetical protein
VIARRERNAIVYEAGLAIDADGSPRAYFRVSSKGIDRLANAGEPGNWFGLVTDDQGDPVVQGEQDPAPGFYISTTALVDHSRKQTDPRRYVDSETVPYISIPKELREQGVKLGDLAMVCRADKRCAAIVADVGPKGKYGEGSCALAHALGIPDDPRKGGCSSGCKYVIFPGTSKGWPRSFAEQAEQLYVAWLSSV